MEKHRSQQGELLYKFTFSQVRFINCNVAALKVEPRGEVHQGLSSNACKAITQYINALSNFLCTEDANQLIDLVGDDCLMHEDRVTIIDAIGKKTNLNQTLPEECSYKKSDTKQNHDFLHNYGTEELWRYTAEGPVRVAPTWPSTPRELGPPGYAGLPFQEAR